MSRIHLEFRSILTAGCLAVVWCLHVRSISLDFETSIRYLNTHKVHTHFNVAQAVVRRDQKCLDADGNHFERLL
jgi:hypothetical protein